MRYGNGLYDGILTRAGILDRTKINLILKMPRQRLSDLYFAYKLVLLEEWHRGVVGTH